MKIGLQWYLDPPERDSRFQGLISWTRRGGGVCLESGKECAWFGLNGKKSSVK